MSGSGTKSPTTGSTDARARHRNIQLSAARARRLTESSNIGDQHREQRKTPGEATPSVTAPRSRNRETPGGTPAPIRAPSQKQLRVSRLRARATARPPEVRPPPSVLPRRSNSERHGSALAQPRDPRRYARPHPCSLAEATPSVKAPRSRNRETPGVRAPSSVRPRTHNSERHGSALAQTRDPRRYARPLASFDAPSRKYARPHPCALAHTTPSVTAPRSRKRGTPGGTGASVHSPIRKITTTLTERQGALHAHARDSRRYARPLASFDAPSRKYARPNPCALAHTTPSVTAPRSRKRGTPGGTGASVHSPIRKITTTLTERQGALHAHARDSRRVPRTKLDAPSQSARVRESPGGSRASVHSPIRKIPSTLTERQGPLHAHTRDSRSNTHMGNIDYN
ncbi:hypothetical protein C2E23DRAFT_856167 [Lenzites betulinus]|nr:hypothetical protein C2E23DRAFT_856167 [Lenzites betulinus]